MDETLKYLIDIVTEDPTLSILLVVVVVLIIQTTVLSVRVGRFLKGENGKSLEGLIQKLKERTAKLETHAKETTLILKEADERLGRSIPCQHRSPPARAGVRRTWPLV